MGWDCRQEKLRGTGGGEIAGRKETSPKFAKSVSDYLASGHKVCPQPLHRFVGELRFFATLLKVVEKGCELLTSTNKLLSKITQDTLQC